MKIILAATLAASTFLSCLVLAGETSIYERKLLDEDNAPTSLSQFKGKLVYVTMAYTSCTGVCRLTMRKLKKIQSELLQKNELAEFVIISLDPSDSPKILKSFYREEQEIKGVNWHFLAASKSDVDAMTKFLGIEYAQAGHLYHEGKIRLLDKEGKLQERSI